MVIRMPTFEIFAISEKDLRVFKLYIFRIKNKITEAKNTLYQTKDSSLSEISFPKTPVKPASNTAACSIKYDFFIISCLIL